MPPAARSLSPRIPLWCWPPALWVTSGSSLPISGMSHEPKSPSLGMLSTATRTTATVNPLTPSPLNGALVPSGSPATSSALSAQAAPSSSFAAALRKLAKQAEEPRGKRCPPGYGRGRERSPRGAPLPSRRTDLLGPGRTVGGPGNSWSPTSRARAPVYSWFPRAGSVRWGQYGEVLPSPQPYPALGTSAWLLLLLSPPPLSFLGCRSHLGGISSADVHPAAQAEEGE